MKVLQLVKGCLDCPRRVYYSGGTYACAEVADRNSTVRLPRREELEDIGTPAWCPLTDYPAAEMERMRAEIAQLKPARGKDKTDDE
jgi:hypothetical protein